MIKMDDDDDGSEKKNYEKEITLSMMGCLVQVGLKDGTLVKGTPYAVYGEHAIVFSDSDGKDHAHVLRLSEIRHVKAILGAPLEIEHQESGDDEDETPVVTRKRFKGVISTDVTAKPDVVTKASWQRRYFLFSRFDDGIQMDEESWYSVTPEPIAQHIARRSRCDVILDACCGAGGNAIQFALTCHHVIACDVSAERLLMARNNAEIYGVQDRIDFVRSDVMQLLRTWPSCSVEVVFLSPPWGGPHYKRSETFSLKRNVALRTEGDIGAATADGVELFKEARRVAKYGVAYFLPRTCSAATLTEELGVEPTEVEEHMVWSSKESFTICAYFGGFLK